jgi:hypothetical protein
MRRTEWRRQVAIIFRVPVEWTLKLHLSQLLHVRDKQTPHIPEIRDKRCSHLFCWKLLSKQTADTGQDCRVWLWHMRQLSQSPVPHPTPVFSSRRRTVRISVKATTMSLTHPEAWALNPFARPHGGSRSTICFNELNEELFILRTTSVKSSCLPTFHINMLKNNVAGASSTFRV